MTRTALFVSALCAGALMVGGTAAQAHSAKTCEKQIKTYSKMCKFSPTAWLIGACTVKETVKACNSKKHKATFHNNKG